MNVVIIGLGEVGQFVAQVLQDEHHDVTAVDINLETVEMVSERMDIATLLGYGANPRVLQMAQVEDADLVVAATDNDEVNLIAALAAKHMGATRTIARLHSGEYEDGLEDEEGIHYGMLGIDLVVNPHVLVAEEMWRISRSHGALDVHLFANNRVELAELKLPADSAVLDTPLRDLQLPDQIRVGAIIRDGTLFVPRGNDVLSAGDRVHLFGRTKLMNEAEDLFCHGREASRVAIFGGNVIGEYLSRHLAESGTDVLLMVDERDNAERLARRLPRVTVIHGDGTDMAKLEEEEVSRYDLYFAVTDDDENNLMSALLAKRLGTPRVGCVVHRHAYIEIYRQLGIDVAISPRQVAADQILRYARPVQVETLVHLGDDEAEVLEVVAAMDSPITGKPLSRVNIPKGVFIGGIITTQDARIPNGDDKVEPGDIVVVLALTEKRSAVERLFRRSVF